LRDTHRRGQSGTARRCRAGQPKRAEQPRPQQLHRAGPPRYNLDKQFSKSPAVALPALHQQATNDSRRDVLFALAELNYLHAHHLRRSVKPGEPARAPDYYLASAIYAYL